MNTTSSASPLNPPGNASFDIRRRYGKPSHFNSVNAPSNAVHVENVLFRHPGYPDTHNILFSLSALDGPGGVHHETARIACALLANSRWDGFLSTTRDGPATLEGPEDALTQPSYYFRLPDSVDERYPIVPDFASFRFPHDNLPPSWLHPSLVIPKATTHQPREGGFANIALARDISCRLTNHSLGTESAHLIPQTEFSWFADNAMFRYALWGDCVTTDDPRNAVLLRSDIQTLFNAQRFVLVPKKGAWVSHVLYGSPNDEMATLYHNVELQPLKEVAVEFLLARFAWAVVTNLLQDPILLGFSFGEAIGCRRPAPSAATAPGRFLGHSVTAVFARCTFILPGPLVRNLLVMRTQTLTQTVREMSGDRYLAEFGPRSTSGLRSRSKSPRKRIRNSSALGDDDQVEGSEDEAWEEESRGRPLKR
ncbi:hypothetical protein F5144DRAFT_612484 [Chaetomium tenue]|uniref:Uncharacterized protein n=1 Tax=Chaetomium tenue TaxID=1854479 RepID=A0ACB7P6T0_9PEZI|nr:hypothetical protein F5144DRAFT_612484 [Chaetomium globosum]